MPGTRCGRPVRERHRGFRPDEVHWLPVLRDRLPVRHPPLRPKDQEGLQVQDVCRPGCGGPRAGLREGLPHRFDPLRVPPGDARLRRGQGREAAWSRLRRRRAVRPVRRQWAPHDVRGAAGRHARRLRAPRRPRCAGEPELHRQAARPAGHRRRGHVGGAHRRGPLLAACRAQGATARSRGGGRGRASGPAGPRGRGPGGSGAGGGERMPVPAGADRGDVIERERAEVVEPEPALVPRYNLFERVLHWAVAITFIALVLSGMALAYPRLAWLSGLFGGGQTNRAAHPSIAGDGIREWSRLIHHAAYLLIFGGLIVHVLLSVFVFPGSLAGMTSGRVTRAWAAWHHPRWFRETTYGEPDVPEPPAAERTEPAEPTP